MFDHLFPTTIMAGALTVATSTMASAQESTMRVSDALGIDAERYEACLMEIDDDPERAMETGRIWKAQGGGWSADHCIALAVVASGTYSEGASRLMSAAESAVNVHDQIRAVMMGQAGDAWLAAGDETAALSAFTRGRFFAPTDAGLALGQAEAALEMEDWAMVEAAAEEAIALDAALADAWRLRGRARLARSDFDGAQADMEQARALAPEDINVLVLRGDILNARRDAGS